MSGRTEDAAQLLSVEKIWNKGVHNAFTDLVRFNDRWFCVFREGEGHASPDGAIRVIVSEQGRNWESAAHITSDDGDLRDPKITVTPDGNLMINAGIALKDASYQSHESRAWWSEDGRNYSGPEIISPDPSLWMWRVTWHVSENETAAYTVGNHTGGGRDPDRKYVSLYRSPDGKTFEMLVPRLFDEGYPNEATILFTDDDRGICVLRRDPSNGSPAGAVVGTAEPPYTDWTWKDTGTKLGGPNVLRLPDGRFVVGARLYDEQVRTSLLWLDTEAGTVTEFLGLPSGGDTSYPGLVYHDGILWVSYYSSHEEKTSIYLAKVKFDW